MILADKIIKLRKKNGWSQEELADKMEVSRQAVSKWESAQTIPNLEKILQLGELFGVTTDYLLKEEIEDEEFIDDTLSTSVKRVSLEQAYEFLALRKTASVRIAFATFLCILSPICLFFLGLVSEEPYLYLSENLAAGIGLGVLILFVTIAAAIYIICGFKNAPYEFLDKGPFETEYGVTGVVKEKQKSYRNTYMKFNVIGTCLCILSPISLFIGAFTEVDLYAMVGLSVTMIIAGIGVVFFIIAGVRWASMEKLLKEGDYTAEAKKKNSLTEGISGIYWLITTAIFLAWSFYTNDWETSWIVWPVAGVVFAAVMIVFNLINKAKEE